MCISSFTVASFPIWTNRSAASGTIDRRRRIPHRLKLLTFRLLAWNIFQDKIFLVEAPPIQVQPKIKRIRSTDDPNIKFDQISTNKKIYFPISENL